MNATDRVQAAPAATTIEEPSVLDQIVSRMEAAVERRMAPAVQPMELRTFAELERWAERAARTDMVPKDYKGKPDNIILAVQMGSELGLRPMQALVNIAVINGRPSVWGDALLALCKMHPAFVSCEETISGAGDARTATCTMIRRGEPPVVRTFSVADAKTAKLWNKKGFSGQDTPWVTHPDRMLQMRARGFAARDAFPDKLRGLISAEEAADIPLEAAGITPTFSAAPEPPDSSQEPQHATVAAMRAWCAEHGEKPTWSRFLDALERELNAAHTRDAVDVIVFRDDVERATQTVQNGNKARLDAMVKAALDRTDDGRMEPASADDFPGVVTPREDV